MSNKPPNVGRGASQSGGVIKPTQNTGRTNAALNKIGASGRLALNAALTRGRQEIHENSATKLRDQRVAIYDKMNMYSGGAQAVDSMRGKASSMSVKAWNSKAGQALQGVNLLGIGDKAQTRAEKAVTEKAERKNIRAEKDTLMPMQSRMEGLNKGAVTAERTGDTLINVRKGATVANHIGTGVSLIAPQVGVGIKAGAKGTKLLAGIAATGAYEKARSSYQGNVRDDASGMNMFDSHIAQEKANLMQSTRNSTAKSTAISAVAGGAMMGVDIGIEKGIEAGMGALNATRQATAITQKTVGTGVSVAEYFGKDALKSRVTKSDKEKIKDNKAELVNLMQHQRSYVAHKERQMGMNKTIGGNTGRKK
ncbi:hypothetical protein [Planctobacterium marinum]|uniref:Uncharacterized protein n=1 Tax=Planctobacterium marinum TaxID=1631968 RepID=A0AA48HN66_9ALTE|nr:hypothetical protein MACH26_33920 [Planctobacterium marinum]